MLSLSLHRLMSYAIYVLNMQQLLTRDNDKSEHLVNLVGLDLFYSPNRG